MAAHWGRVGKNLGNAVGAYNSTVASLESRVLRSARRFEWREAMPDGREIAHLDQVEVLPRALSTNTRSRLRPFTAPLAHADMLCREPQRVGEIVADAAKAVEAERGDD
jgi:hypothetical protein